MHLEVEECANIYLVAIWSLKNVLACAVKLYLVISCCKIFYEIVEHWCVYSFFFSRCTCACFYTMILKYVLYSLQIISYRTGKVREGWLEEHFEKCSCDEDANSSGKPCAKILPSSELDEEREKEIKHTWYHNQCRHPTSPSTK